MLSFLKKSNTDRNEMGPEARVIAFLNQKGGVGKTTMCFNAAHALAEQGKRVLCIDMDPQANLSLLFGVDLAEKENAYSVHQLLINSVRELKALHMPALVSDVIYKGERGVDLLPAGQELSGFELSVAGISSPRQLILKKLIEKFGLGDDYDYIVLDCPPTLGLLVVNVLCASDGCMVPFRPDEFSKKGLGHFYEVLEDISDMGVTKMPEVLAHIPNLVDARRKQEAGDLERITSELRENFGDIKMVSPFFNRAQLVKSQAQRKSVFEFKGKEFSDLRSQFNELATIITEWSDVRQ
mgnify:CR=1 FL=1